MANWRAGIFVGGRATRFGGIAKGLLRSGGVTLVERAATETRTALPDGSLTLVGEATAYADLGLPSVADDPPGVGPIGGLRALLRAAQQAGERGAIAIACDMPYVSASLIERLATSAPDVVALAPHDGERWYPLCARYRVEALPVIDRLLAQSRHSLQRIFSELGDAARALPLTADEFTRLRDWDRPEDLSDAEAHAADAPVRQ